MNPPIIYIGGSKGGVGKSKTCFSIINYLVKMDKKILLLETDTSNADVYKAHIEYQDELNIICKEVNLDIPDGWIELINLADKYTDSYVVINSAARSNSGVEKYSTTLRDTLGELNRTLVTLWLINRQRDSVELLRAFINSFPDALIYVLRNLYFGSYDKFELYNNSKARMLIEKKGNTLDFPDLADRVADKIYSGRFPISIAKKEMPIGDRAELNRWENECDKIFHTILQ